MRELTSQRIEGKGGGQDTTAIIVCDEPGQGGACHKYAVVKHAIRSNDGEDVGYLLEHLLTRVEFQNGPIQEVGVNGVQQEHLLAIVEDRLASFQAGPFANAYNAEALAHVQAAMAALHRRTTDRIARQVEGFNKA